ncbi:MAG: ISAs1 family transposase [Candidatus Nitrosomaritimum yanchengensis]
MDLAELHLHWGASTYKGKKYVTYSLAKSVWVNGSCRKKIVLKLGKLSDEQVLFWRNALKVAKGQHQGTTSEKEIHQEHASSFTSIKVDELTTNPDDLHTGDLKISKDVSKDNGVLVKKKYSYTEEDQNIDLQSYEYAVKHAFADVIDPRVEDNLRYPFYGLLLSILAGVLAGGSSITAIHQYAEEKAAIFCPLLNLERHPSYMAFWWILSRTDPKALNQAFIKWIKLVAETVEGNEKKIAIDGKTVRGAKKNLVHYVSGYECTKGLLLGQVKTEEKSNEITAIPELLKVIDVKDATVTIDAMGCQKAITTDIRERGGHYVIALKGNQETLEAEARNFFDQARAADYKWTKCKIYEATNKGHGRIEKREVVITQNLKWLDCRDNWRDLNAMIEVKSTRTVKGKTTEELRYYISSKAMTAKEANSTIRGHWGIENQLHWVLDVLFNDDAVRGNTGHVAENLALFRRMAYCILKQETVRGRGLASKRRKAMWNERYVLELLGKFIKEVSCNGEVYKSDSG